VELQYKKDSHKYESGRLETGLIPAEEVASALRWIVMVESLVDTVFMLVLKPVLLLDPAMQLWERRKTEKSCEDYNRENFIVETASLQGYN
jgi:hypothetical protein